MKNKHKKSPREVATSTKGKDKTFKLNYNKKEEKKQEVCSICENPLLPGVYSQYGTLKICFICDKKAEIDLEKTISCTGSCGDRATSIYSEYPLCAVCRRLAERNSESIKEETR